MAWQYNILGSPFRKPPQQFKSTLFAVPAQQPNENWLRKTIPELNLRASSRAFRGRASAAIVYSPQYHRARVGFIFSFLVNDDRFIPRRILLQVFAVVKGCEPHSE
jgi:hypothetical protein